MSEIDLMAEKAKSDEIVMNELIAKKEIFILRCASSAARNYISKNDDEWFVALGAFSESIELYSLNIGSFLIFAELRIRKSISNFIRSQFNYVDEDAINFSTLALELNGNDDCIAMEALVLKDEKKEVGNILKLEIELANDVLSSYGFTFFDLIDCSPKSRRAKKICVKAVSYMIENPILISNMKVKKSLQTNTIQKNVRVSRKLLEHYQKYIIAAVEIISGEYTCLPEYMRFIREGLKNESCSS